MFISFAALAQTAMQSPLPALTGKYAVGRVQFAWTDSSRADADQPTGHREIVVWVWYPVSPNQDESALWMPGKWADAFWTASVKQTPSLAESGNQTLVAAIRAHALSDAVIAAGKQPYPVLLFEPGAGEIPLSYASLIEDMASHGYVVVGIVPTGYTRFSIFPDGRLDLSDKFTPPLPPGSDKKTSDDQKPFPISGATIYLTQAQMQTFQEGFRDRLRAGFLVWVQDMAFALDQLEKLNQDNRSQFKGRLDLTRVGAFGHSLGGAASLQAAKDDSRIGAAVDLDGRLFGTSADGGVPKPLLMITEFSNAVFNAAASTGKPGYHVILRGSKHFFSSDWGFLPFSSTQIKAQRVGDIDPVRASSITKTYVEAFFDQYLKGIKTTLFDGPSQLYPEITFEPVFQDKYE
jgi:dienelactone hydrolase